MTTEYKQGTLYVVELDEIDWYYETADKPIEDAREHIRKKYRNAARTNKCLHIVIFVTPDALFPLSENKDRHRVYLHSFVDAERTYTFKHSLDCQIEPHVFDATDAKGQQQLIDECIKHALDTLREARITKCDIKVFSGKTLIRHNRINTNLTGGE